MKTTTQGNGGASNPSNKAVLKTEIDWRSKEARKTLAQSLYIAALDRYLGKNGLIFPVTIKHKKVEYDFDFFHPESDELVKVFTVVDDERAEQRYLALPYKVTYILDLSSEGMNCGWDIENLSIEAGKAAVRLEAYVYFAERFWIPRGQPKIGHLWEEMLPVEWDSGFDAGMEYMDKEDSAPNDDEDDDNEEDDDDLC
jgi:hypothetical protein